MTDKALAALYPVEGEYRLLTIKLREARLLFNPLDPAPHAIRELAAEAGDWLFDGARELPGAQLKVVLYLPQLDPHIRAEDMSAAIGHYFYYRGMKYRQQLRHLLRIGRQSLLIGLLFLVVCDLIARYVLAGEAGHLGLARTGVSILGWVAMWKPVEIFLYEWWPLRQNARSCDKLMSAPVEVRERKPGDVTPEYAELQATVSVTVSDLRS